MRYYPQIEIDIEKAAEFMELTPSKLEEIIEKRNLKRNWDEYNNIYRFEGHAPHMEDGTVLIDHHGSFELVRGFPKIKRAMLLEPAVKESFSGIDIVAVEEKMNGYNVRVIEYNGKLIAFTRSGHVCPYSTERVQNLLKMDIFADHPDIVIYGEMVGPENPYVQKHVYGIDSLEFFVFDIRYKDTGQAIPVTERRELAERYGFKQARLFGEFAISEASERITEIIRELGKKGREGVVIKDPKMVLQPIKYTCSESNCNDLRQAFKFYNEAGRDYLFSRVVREGFQSYEWKESEEEFRERCLRLGESILRPMKSTIEQVESGVRISDEFRIRVRDRNIIDRFRSYLERLGLYVIFEEPEKEGDEYVINVRKMNKSTNDKTLAMLEGQLWS
ncbi:RNA ligase [Methanolobus profundi]|uniref:Putative ATP-dependent DNA ligase n=1 Tax=Methanolobus profundi TaxID=487685 RepID=A0A1I4T8Q9_9EURY|nr:RNA ligase [Methanolobus profundi]SFM72960.1 putative ATP-dependent DNA ligase [Methanolobus profundi]